MDLCNPWIALRKSWIRTLRGQSMDCALIAVRLDAMRIPCMYMAYINWLPSYIALHTRPVVYPCVACIHQLAS